MCSVTVIIPTLNEEENIDPLLTRLFAVRSKSGLNFSVLFVDSASTDKTGEKVMAWQEKGDVFLLCLEPDDDLMEVVVAGACAADTRFVVVMDADLSHPPELLPELITPLLKGSCDMVIGSRYVAGAAMPDWPFYRRFASKLATIPARLFTNVKDPLAGFFAVERERLASLDGSVHGFKVGLEVLAGGGQSLRVREVPIIFRDRSFGVSKMNFRVVFHYLVQLFHLLRKKFC
ncbi:polyprenol monophosphomannose synthase [Desulfomarina sp.]